MCFSATASLTSGVILLGAGAYTCWRVPQPRQKLIATIPFMFGLQQIAEGGVWLSLDSGTSARVEHASILIFALFAYALWPLIIPWMMLAVETSRTRRYILLALAAGGSLVGVTLLRFLIGQPISASKHLGGIAYHFHAPDYAFAGLAIYLLATCGAMMISSLKIMRTTGAAILLAAIVSHWIHYETFASTWCFFSALISMMIIVSYARDRAEVSIVAKPNRVEPAHR